MQMRPVIVCGKSAVTCDDVHVLVHNHDDAYCAFGAFSLERYFVRECTAKHFSLSPGLWPQSVPFSRFPFLPPLHLILLVEIVTESCCRCRCMFTSHLALGSVPVRYRSDCLGRWCMFFLLWFSHYAFLMFFAVLFLKRGKTLIPFTGAVHDLLSRVHSLRLMLLTSCRRWALES